ncbi:hypothetical protein HPB47_005692 [Ixodes persulcatus]|uniref:Uncharacterized protein n=1 Tax=Ixodes persulcatus TaxID=34615 RepID=A0AC60PC71_IXOPE|nr:hypothetical protein HPB47_005692 [Ixodes persulcatus]
MEAGKTRESPGPDSRWSWVVVGFLAWVMATSTLSSRAMGVFYIGIVEHFGVSREEASWPLSLHSTSFCMAGPVFGYLCELWPCQRVLQGCLILSGIGLTLCYFAPNTGFLAIFFGVVHGGALSGTFVVLLQLVCQYFKTWRTTACSITWSSQCLTAFVMSQTADYIRTAYGTPEMFLLIGALSFNAFPAAFVLKSPPWTARRTAQKTNAADSIDARRKHLPECDALVLTDATVNNDDRSMPRHFVLRTTHARSWLGLSSELKATLKVFFSVLYQIDAFSFSVQLLNVTVFFLVNVDLATDGGIDTSQAVYLAHVYSVGDFIVRLLSGLIVDRGYLSLATAMLLGFSGCAAGFEALVWSTSMASFVASSMLLGAGGGFMAPLCGPILTSDFVGRSLPVLFGGLMFMNGLVLIAIPSLVAGYSQAITLPPRENDDKDGGVF